MSGSQDVDDVWDFSGSEPERGSGRKADHRAGEEQDKQLERSMNRFGSSLEDSRHNRELQKVNDRHKRALEVSKADFERKMEEFRARHDRWTNYLILGIVSVLFLASVAILSLVAYQVDNQNTLRDKAITLLAPLTGLALGFLSGKIKWPAL
jgi:hypothetical protein